MDKNVLTGVVAIIAVIVIVAGVFYFMPPAPTVPADVGAEEPLNSFDDGYDEMAAIWLAKNVDLELFDRTDDSAVLNLNPSTLDQIVSDLEDFQAGS